MKLPAISSSLRLAGLLTASLVASPLASRAAEPAVTAAIAVISSTEGNSVSGTVKFTKVEGGVHVVAHVMGLKPGGHGFHIHQFGDISAKDGTGTGGHFNPKGHEHGAPMSEMRHAGDLGNLVADENGHAMLDMVDKHLSFEGADSFIGRGIIIHADPDDLKTQPTGNAGKRVAQAVIGVAKP
jgi:superoxide dismutase, Cu-Zn family